VFIFRFLASGNSQNIDELQLENSTLNCAFYNHVNLRGNLEQIISNRITTTDRRRVGEYTEEFYSLWHFPNCVGAIDGKHIEIQATHNSCSLFFNYKKTFL